MKNIRSLIRATLTCAIALGVICSATAQTIQGKAKVVRIAGHARFTTGNNVWQPLKVGDVLNPGTIIQTDKSPGSYVDVVLGDGKAPVASVGNTAAEISPITASVSSFQPKSEQNIVRIWENSALGIDKLTSTETGADTVTDTQLDLRSGHIFGTVKKVSAASRYEIKLPNGVAGIRGTCYDLDVNGHLKIGNGSGVVSTVGADNKPNTKTVPAGYEYDPTTGQLTPLPPAEMNGLNKLEMQVRVEGGVRVVTFTSDHTIHHISHTHGHRHQNDDDQGEDNDDQ